MSPSEHDDVQVKAVVCRRLSLAAVRPVLFSTPCPMLHDVILQSAAADLAGAKVRIQHGLGDFAHKTTFFWMMNSLHSIHTWPLSLSDMLQGREPVCGSYMRRVGGSSMAP